MGLYTWLKKTFQKEYQEKSPEYKARLQKWRKEGAIEMVGKPTNLARARNLGYKAKEGYTVVRVKTSRGKRAKKRPTGGRKPKKNIKYVSPNVSYQSMAEGRAGRKYQYLEVFNSYWVGEDGVYKYFEIIMVDPIKVKLKENLRVGRAFRGLTSSGKKHRGLRHKGKLHNQSVR